MGKKHNSAPYRFVNRGEFFNLFVQVFYLLLFTSYFFTYYSLLT
jgi:hypothetical protein